jgi:hypothetical protein
MEALLAGAVAAGQVQQHHTTERRQDQALFDAELLQTAQYHDVELGQTADFFKRQQATAWELHHMEMEIAVDLAKREAMRDIWQQRQIMNQTILVVDALMFSCAFVAITQPPFPEAVPLGLLYIYTVSLAAAVALLTLSMWVSFKLQSRMGYFVIDEPALQYSCGNTHADFNSYFSCHCESLRLLAVAGFFLGTCCVLVGSAATFAMQMATSFDDTTSAVVYAAILFVSVVGVIVVELVVSDKTETAVEFGGTVDDGA